MGFFAGLMDFAGDMVGRMAERAEEIQQREEELQQEVQRYKIEYKSLSNNDLIEKYKLLRSENTSDQTAKNRLRALIMVMQDRGMIKAKQ